MKKRMPLEKNTRRYQQPKGSKYRPKWATTSRKPLAPYSHTLAAKRQQWGEVNVHIFAGQDRWKRAKQRNSYDGPACGLVLPEHAQPQQFRWPILGVPVFVVLSENHTRQNAVDIAEVFYSNGADLIVVAYGPNHASALYWVDQERGAT